MVIILPEPLQKEAKDLAKREGIDLETLVIRAVKQLLRKQQYPNPQVSKPHQHLEEYNRYKTPTDDQLSGKDYWQFTPRQRLCELSRRKLTEGDDFITEVRLAKARAYQLYLDNEDWFELSAQRIAGSHQAYLDELGSEE